jgi:hypothetical protein
MLDYWLKLVCDLDGIHLLRLLFDSLVVMLARHFSCETSRDLFVKPVLVVQFLLIFSKFKLIAQDFEAKEGDKALLDTVSFCHLPGNHDIDSNQRVKLDLLLLDVPQVISL